MADRLELIPLDRLPAAAVENAVRDCGVSRLLTEPPFASEPRHAYLLAVLREDLAHADTVATASLRQGAVTGLSVVRFHQWDEEHFGFRVGRVEHLFAADDESAHALAGGIVRDLDARGTRMSSARLSLEALTAIHALETQGFRLQELTLAPWRSLADWQPQGYGVTRETRPDEVPELCALARRAFRTDRFHNDPRFDRAAADGLYERWVRTWHENPSAEKWSWVLPIDGRPAGFILFEITARAGRRVAQITLDCVSAEHTRRGHAYRMQCDALDYLSGHADYASGIVAARNPAIVSVKMRLGFRFSGGDVTLHRWLQAGDR